MVPSYVRIDRYTDEIASVLVNDVYVRDKIGYTKLIDTESIQTGYCTPSKGDCRQEQTYNERDASGIGRLQRSGIRSQAQSHSNTLNQQQSLWAYEGR